MIICTQQSFAINEMK